jgi:uncharacterized membrane protein
MDIFSADLYLHIQVTYHLFLTNLVFIVVTDGKLVILFGTKSKDTSPQASFDLLDFAEYQKVLYHSKM